MGFAKRFLIDGKEEQIDFQALGNFPPMKVGQTLRVTEVDANGAPTKWEAGALATSQTVTLTVDGWVQGEDGRYAQTVAVEGVTTDTEVILVDVELDTDDTDARAEYLAAWAGPSANEVDQGDGTLTFYAAEVPTVNLPVNVGWM